MDDNGVDTAFDMIFEEIDQVINELNQKGAGVFEKGDYKEVSRLKEVGEQLIEFREKISELKLEWDSNFADILTSDDVKDVHILEIDKPEQSGGDIGSKAETLSSSQLSRVNIETELSFSPGDYEFLQQAETKLSRQAFQLAKQLLLEVRDWYQGELQFQAVSKYYKETPDNFWAVQIQTRKDRLQVTIQKIPEHYHSDIFDLQLTFRTYTKFFLETEDQLAEALRLIKESAKYKGISAQKIG